MLAGARPDRPSTTPHRSPPECFRNYRLPLTTALTDNILGAFAATDNPQTTASTDHFLGAFGQTGNPEELVQRPDAEPANDPNHPPQITLNAQQITFRRSVCIGIVRPGISAFSISSKCWFRLANGDFNHKFGAFS